MKSILTILLILWVGVPSWAQSPLKILRIGDSNTSGYTGRNYFKDLMEDAGIPWEAQGTRKAWAHFGDHNFSEGWGGTKIEFFTEFQISYKDEILNYVPIERILDQFSPDVIFLMVGTNNMSGTNELDLEDLTGKFEVLLDEIDDRVSGTTKIFVSTILPAKTDLRNDKSTLFNEEVVKPLVQEREVMGKPYYLVDNNAVIDRNIHLMDEVHANNEGMELMNLNWFNHLLDSFEPLEQSPFNGQPFLIPGVIEAEDYDFGGAGIAYQDTDHTNEGAGYRSDGVDIEATLDVDGGYNLGWTANGEWTEYTVDVQGSGMYDVVFRIATEAETGRFSMSMDGVEIVPQQVVPNTGGWQVWEDLTVDDVYLEEGEHVMRFTIGAGPFNLNHISISSPILGLEIGDKALRNYAVYPNPSSGKLDWAVVPDGVQELRLKSETGQVLVQGVYRLSDLGFTDFPSGLYLLEVLTTTQVQSIHVTKY